MSRRTSLHDVFNNPALAARRIVAERSIYGLIDMRLVGADETAVVYHLTLAPLAPLAQAAYPQEHLSLLLSRKWGAFARPLDEEDPTWYPSAPHARFWAHRYSDLIESPHGPPPWQPHLGQLCLWFPGDPAELRWQPTDGLEAFITIAHRHLMAEEFARRNSGEWPAPFAPHGIPPKLALQGYRRDAA